MIDCTTRTIKILLMALCNDSTALTISLSIYYLMTTVFTEAAADVYREMVRYLRQIHFRDRRYFADNFTCVIYNVIFGLVS